MIWILLGVIALSALVAFVLIRQRANDIEEVILQGRPVLLRCGKQRIEKKIEETELERSVEGSC